MPRGKNYVNNDKGVVFCIATKKKPTMILCEYGSGCNRPDCIYRHEDIDRSEEVCLPFLVGKCTFSDKGCRKRHPNEDECKRLISKYKRTRCRFGDECFTESCLYLHPKEAQEIEPHFVEPHHVAFPALNGKDAPAPKPVANSAWKNAPVVKHSSVHALAPAWYPELSYQNQISAPYYTKMNVDPTGKADIGYYDTHNIAPEEATKITFNIHAKEFIPGSSA